MYNGKAYTQGQKWSDKCDKNCVCDDAKQGLYTCTDRYSLCDPTLFICLYFIHENPSQFLLLFYHLFDEINIFYQELSFVILPKCPYKPTKKINFIVNQIQMWNQH